MPREVPADLQTLLDDPKVEVHSTLDLIYSDASATERHWAAGSLEIGAVEYSAYLKKIGDVRQSLSSSTDRVSVELFNNDNVVCADVASALKYFNYAEAVIGRYHTNGSLEEHRTIFRGRVMQPEVTERIVSFSIVDSLVSAGLVIASRPLTVKCPFRFKDPRTCAYVGVETSCNKLPNSTEGCRGRNNTARFGGWFFPYSSTATAPSGSGSGISSGGNGPTCFTGDTLISMADGTLKPIRYVRPGDKVLSFYYDASLKRDVVKPSTVLETFHHDVWEHFDLTFEDGTTLEVTEEHPLYVSHGAFYLAGQAHLKQAFSYLDRNLYGSYGLEKKRISSMRWNNAPYLDERPVKVYNFHVAEHHTYFANGIAVHNSKPLEEILY